MYFVVRFRRSTRELLGLDEFTDPNDAYDKLAASERESPGSDIELVLLSADSRASLERTHSRYFAPSERLLDQVS